MSVQNELARLGLAKSSIAQAITGKGVDVPRGALLDDYPALIEQIKSGGSAGAKDINFCDYDGTLLYSYTADEFASVTELPTPPSHDRLTFQRWNWSLSKIKALGRAIDVGAMYVTESGKSEFDLTITDVTGLAATLRVYNVTSGNTITVDWGDGTTNSSSTSSGAKTLTHTYESPGTYTATVDSTGAYYPYGTSSTPFNMFGANPGYICTAVRLGARCSSISSYAFQSCYSLTSVTIPASVTSIGTECTFQYCYSLRSITVPDGVTSIAAYSFGSCYTITKILLPDGVTSIGNTAFYNCYGVTSVTIPDSVTSLGSSLFMNCYSLRSAVIPDGVPAINSSMCGVCYGLREVRIPASVTSIGASAFQNCYGIKRYRMLSEVPPTMSNTSAMTGINQACVIEVPRGTLEAYRTATNWATYANYMREAA